MLYLGIFKGDQSFPGSHHFLFSCTFLNRTYNETFYILSLSPKIIFKIFADTKKYKHNFYFKYILGPSTSVIFSDGKKYFFIFILIGILNNSCKDTLRYSIFLHSIFDFVSNVMFRS